MILVDSSVWIDYFNGEITHQTAILDRLLGAQPLFVGDLILAEVLQGFDADKDFDRARKLMQSFDLIELGGRQVAVQAARNFRTLRSKGVTVRKTIDVLIATKCLMAGIELLHDDRDFDPFEKHLGLRVVRQK